MPATLKFLSVLFFSSFLAFQSNAQEPTRRELKKMCKAKRKQCRKDGGKYFACRKVWRQCRKENGVTFVDDLKYVVQKITAAVKVTAGEDDDGEYNKLTVVTKRLSKLPEFKFTPKDLSSNVEFDVLDKEQQIRLTFYESDLEGKFEGEDLQTSEGRSFPKFYDGRQFDTLYGKKFSVANGYEGHVYIDGQQEVFGLFLPANFVGKVISWINRLKNKVKWLSWIPDINSIPITIKLKGEKIGRVYILASDSEGKRSGFLALFDDEAIDNVLKEEDDNTVQSAELLTSN